MSRRSFEEVVAVMNRRAVRAVGIVLDSVMRWGDCSIMSSRLLPIEYFYLGRLIQPNCQSCDRVDGLLRWM